MASLPSTSYQLPFATLAIVHLIHGTFTCSRTGYISKFLLTKHKTSGNRSKMLPAILPLLPQLVVVVVVSVVALLMASSLLLSQFTDNFQALCSI